MEVYRWVEESRVMIGMLMVQVFATGLQLLSRIILSEGTFVFALIAYRQLVGAICVAPIAFFTERGKTKKLSWSIWLWLFMVALTGVSMGSFLFYFGLRDTTATYATNLLNLVPITTFIFSALLRIEKLALRTMAGKVKTMGALLCLVGALVVSLYNGKVLQLSHHDHHHHQAIEIIKKTKQNWVRGTLFLVGSVLSYSVWFILQVKLNKIFPYKYSYTMLVCIIASIQQVIIGFCVDRSKASWKLGWNLQLVTVVYSGALGTAITFCLISWTIVKKGPTYPSMFNPVSMILVTITEALFLGQDMRVGSLLGMCVIVVGLYLFLWAKNKEIRSMVQPEAMTNIEEQKTRIAVLETTTS